MQNKFFYIKTKQGFPSGLVVKNPPATQEIWIQSLGQEDTRRWKRQPTPVFLPGKSHRGPRKLQSTGSQRVGHALPD